MNGVTRNSRISATKSKNAKKNLSSPEPADEDEAVDDTTGTPASNSTRTPVVSSATKLRLAAFSANEGVYIW